MIRAISFTIGAEIRKENVTPRGIPAVMKPMKSGTAEQEQKGVITPSRAASTLPAASLFPESSLSGPADGDVGAGDADQKHYQYQQHQYLWRIVDKKAYSPAEMAFGVKAEQGKRKPLGKRVSAVRIQTTRQ